MNPHDCVARLLHDRPRTPRERGEGRAPANIALVKYWGKRDRALNLPVTGSLSISLGDRGARTVLTPADRDTAILDGTPLSAESPFHRRAFTFLDLLRGPEGPPLHLQTAGTIPVAAGLASSAAGFAALVRAADDLFGWGLEDRTLSILARMGSGSACRSLAHGFVEWVAGAREDGLDSFAEPLPDTWPELCVGLLIHEPGEKPIGSRDAMNRTVETSRLYRAWPGQVAADLAAAKQAIRRRDIQRLGETAEANALAMHATMLGARPPICYWTPRTLEILQTLRTLRAAGTPAYATLDAGPNVKLLFEAPHTDTLRRTFPSLDVVYPFKY